MRSLLLSSAICLSACAPDPLLGTFDFSLTGTDTETAPRNQSTTVTGTGTMSFTVGKTADYVMTLAHGNGAPCVFELDRNDKGDAISIPAGQTCTITNSAGTATATITTGSITVADKGTSATVNASYTYTGTTFGINFAGTGVRTYTGPRR